MEAVEIRYARTADGVDIAYATMGEGPPIILMPEGVLAWTMVAEIPEWSPFLDALAAAHTLVLFDMRGSGNSDRTQLVDRPEKALLDTLAVLDHLSLPPAALVARGPNAPFALRLVAEHPEAFSHLVLLDPLLTYRLLLESGFSRINRVAVETNYDFWLNSIVVGMAGELCDASRHKLLAIGKLTSREAMLALMEGYAGIDGAEFAPRVSIPTLVIQKEQTVAVPPHLAREVVAAIPGARLVRVREGGWVLCDDPAGETLHAIQRFLGEGVRPSSRSDAAFRTILFTDLEGHTAMMTRLGDERGRTVLREHERITRDVLASNGGTEIKTAGDGFMASFGSAQKALECAIALQQRVADGIGGEQLRIRAGINAGEPVEEDGDLFGASVITAARIAATAEGGQVLVADVVRQLVAGKGFLFHDTGEHVLKGMEDPVRVWELRWEGA